MKKLLLSLFMLACSSMLMAQGGGNTFDEFMGTNGFIDDPIDKISCVGNIREYHPWSFNVPDGYSGDGSDITYEFNRWSGFWDFDAYYADLKAANIDVIAVLWEAAPWMQDIAHAWSVYGHKDDIPVDSYDIATFAADQLLPAKYQQKAEYHWQYAARYGAVQHPDGDLKVAAGQTRVSGLNTLQYYEDWNEQDRTWHSVSSYFSPEAYAAMASACVDGHGGTMPGNVGVKNADPNAIFVMGGVANLGTDYVSRMKTWFEANRPQGDWPIDVINMHHYTNAGGDQGGAWTQAESPEDGDLKGKIMVVMNWIATNTPGAEFWLSEWGYDVNQASDNKIVPFGGKTADQIFSEWILRGYLVQSSTGMARTQQYMLRDVEEVAVGTTRFNTSGLITCPGCSGGGQLPKLSWYDTYALKNALTGFSFVEVVEETTAAYVYKFHNATTGVDAWACWSPTANGVTNSNYQLNIGLAPGAYKMIPNGTSINGQKTGVTLSGSTVTLDLEEMPTIVIGEVPTFDAVAPSTPGNLTATRSGVLLQIAWTASTDNVGVAGYEVYHNGTLKTTATSLTYNLIGVAEGAAYTITVYAVDAEGNKSAAASIVEAGTPAGVADAMLDEAVVIYPNPTAGQTVIAVSEEVQVMVTNSLGAVVILTTVPAGQQTLDLSAQAAGIYHVTITNGLGQTSRRIVKQ